MRIVKTASLASLCLFVFFLASGDCLAAQRLHRRSGHLWGNGYHVCNPGPDSSYYCPWSPLNTPQSLWWAAPTTAPAAPPRR